MSYSNAVDKDGNKKGFSSSLVDGWKSWKDMPENAVQAGLNGARGVEDLASTVYENITNAEGSDGFFKDLKKDGADRQISLDLKYKFGELKEILDEKDGVSKDDVVAASEILADEYGELLGVEDVEVILYDGLYVSDQETDNGVDKSATEGFHESNTRRVAINLDKVQNTEDLIATLAHEFNHVDDMDRGIAYDGLDGTREDIAHATGDQMREFLQDDFGVAEDNSTSHQSWMYRQDFSAENSLVDEVREVEPLAPAVGAVIGGVAGGAGAAWGAYVAGGDFDAVLKAGGMGVVIGAASGAYFNAVGVMGAMGIGAFSGGGSAALLTDEDTSIEELISNTAKGALGGSTTAMIATPIGAIGGVGGIGELGAAIYSAKVGLEIDLILGTVSNSYDLKIPTRDDKRIIIPKGDFPKESRTIEEFIDGF